MAVLFLTLHFHFNRFSPLLPVRTSRLPHIPNRPITAFKATIGTIPLYSRFVAAGSAPSERLIRQLVTFQRQLPSPRDNSTLLISTTMDVDLSLEDAGEAMEAVGLLWWESGAENSSPSDGMDRCRCPRFVMGYPRYVIIVLAHSLPDGLGLN